MHLDEYHNKIHSKQFKLTRVQQTNVIPIIQFNERWFSVIILNIWQLWDQHWIDTNTKKYNSNNQSFVSAEQLYAV